MKRARQVAEVYGLVLVAWLVKHGFIAIPKLSWKLYRMLRMLWRARHTTRKERQTLRLFRMPRCRKCPLYNPKHRTCGYIGEWDADGLPLGCWCWLPLATGVPEKRCWLAEVGLEDGWGVIRTDDDDFV